jgi:hypothetical protein
MRIIGSGYIDPPFIQELNANLTPFAKHVVRAQAAQMNQYTCHLADDIPIEQTVYIVKRMGTPLLLI